ncbi:FAD binding domain protein [Xylariales sp. AK1849]|nr:FAD binding domain protein [Xylariales sp. AK1849]
MVSTCCSRVVEALGDKVFYPETAAYNATEASYWSTQEAVLAPACVVLPQTKSDVAMFINTVTAITNCDFAVKTQGHAPAAGFANIDGGVTLDLSWLNSTTINADHSVASVGAGSAWVDVYSTLNPYNKTVAGGRNGAVGVGGLTLGGGISYYSPEVGFTCDTVLNFEIVLASGDIVDANSTYNPDLFRALKGGGNNFGIVTRIDFKTVETVPLRAGHLFQSSEYAEEILEAFVGIASADTYDVHASIVTSFTFNVTTGAWSVVSVPIYTLSETEPDIYKKLFSIPNITALTTVSIENISTLAAEAAYPQKYESFHTSTYAASADLLTTIFKAANESLTSLKSPTDISWSIAFEPLPTALVKHGQGTNSLGTSTTDGNGVILLLSVSWTNSASTTAAERIGRALMDTLDKAASGKGGLRGFKYLNYANPSQDPYRSYGKENLCFLRNVSAKYDPRRNFQSKVPGGFKLW